MATYFHGNTEIQGGGDGLQTLILMNPAYVGYSDTHPQLQTPPATANFVFLNSNSSAASTLNLSHHHQPPPFQIQHFAGGIPLQASAASPQDSHQHQDVSHIHYNLYNPPINFGAAAREVTRAKQGLSLSLSSQQPTRFGSPVTSAGGEVVRVSGPGSSASGISNSVNGALLSSKYLKAAQELLDEVVNVKEEAKNANESAKEDNGQQSKNNGGGESGGESVAKRGAELTTAEKQEIQMKKAKLVNMLDEVEQRYKQYHHQMQMVISWFEQVAGIGSAKTYTSLALKTISKQFRCLKDAILGQIRVARKNLGEEDSLGGKIEGSSRLKYVDNQIRQQRALQQLGMIHHNTWRPQRGLPERSVSVLRTWLFEHFLHPYPKDSDKVMLAKQTGLTRSQVSNWFINARVRLWKPMVEEMYTEEIKEHGENGSEDKTGKTEQNEVSTSKSTASQAKLDNLVDQSNIVSVTSPTEATMKNNVGFNLIGLSEMERITQGSPKKQRNSDMLHSPRSIPSMNMESKPMNVDNEQMSMKFGNEKLHERDGFTLMGAPTNFIGGFESYPIVELGRFGPEQFQAPYSGNGVSLTLGLPHCENLSMSGAHETFLQNQSIQLRRGVEIGEANDFGGMNTATSTQSTSVYENINIQNRKRFAAQLLPDFVT